MSNLLKLLINNVMAPSLVFSMQCIVLYLAQTIIKILLLQKCHCNFHQVRLTEGITSLVRSTILHTTYFPMADLATQNSLGRAVIPRQDTEGSTQHTNY